MANYKSIADYLQQKRNQANLTQEQLCQVLAAFSPEFSELDALAVKPLGAGQSRAEFKSAIGNYSLLW